MKILILEVNLMLVPESILDLRENMLRGVFLISVSLKANYKSQFTYLNSEVTISNARKRQQFLCLIKRY